MKLTKLTAFPTIALAVALLAAATLLPAHPAAATDAMAKSTQLACTACHDKPGSKLLTAKGKYFETMGSLDGYEALEVAFKDCTACHVAKPGSSKLTAKGKEFAGLVKDMKGLAEWLKSAHPAKPARP
ncbi:MAG: hypothetical protein IPJ17_05595 [Holophagales bacterium]|nr:MAG: hypothetical protein IPJ17_05595 [Holophagales bacterium]